MEVGHHSIDHQEVVIAVDEELSSTFVHPEGGCAFKCSNRCGSDRNDSPTIRFRSRTGIESFLGNAERLSVHFVIFNAIGCDRSERSEANHKFNISSTNATLGASGQDLGSEMEPRCWGRCRGRSLREDGLVALLLRQHLGDVRGKRHDSEPLKDIEQWSIDVDCHHPTTIAEVLDELLPEAFATVREACRRLKGSTVMVTGTELSWDMVPYDVQLIGGIQLHLGRIAEMATGEGKTLAFLLPVFTRMLAPGSLGLKGANAPYGLGRPGTVPAADSSAVPSASTSGSAAVSRALT
jgi:hypothetical protein